MLFLCAPAGAQVRQPSAVLMRRTALAPAFTSPLFADPPKRARPFVLIGALGGAAVAVALVARPVYEAEFAPAWIVYGGAALAGASIGAVIGRVIFDAAR